MYMQVVSSWNTVPFIFQVLAVDVILFAVRILIDREHPSKKILDIEVSLAPVSNVVSIIQCNVCCYESYYYVNSTIS